MSIGNQNSTRINTVANSGINNNPLPIALKSGVFICLGNKSSVLDDEEPLYNTLNTGSPYVD